MLGFFSGIFLSVWYRKEGPQQPVYVWMDEAEESNEESAVIDKEPIDRAEFEETK
jgi:hypothetical protein